MGSLRTIIERYHLERWFNRDNLIVLVLLGLLLVVIGIPVEDGNEGQEKGQVSNHESQEETQGQTNDNQYEYAEYLEKKLEDTLKEMRGVGRVEVMITLETTQEQVVEKDQPITRNNTAENDASGGSRTIYQMDSGQETVYVKEDGNETPYVTKTIYPKISGVLVVAEGAGTGTVTSNISQIAQTLFDVEAHKVQVMPMGE
ncbi:MAG: stage III sporulation protein AG [Lachnospiraceae bacterium]|nr:stage III sporulation protein AG [Lachnospiraceae bacterium]